MYTETLPTNRLISASPSMGVASMAFALLGSAFAVDGTGSSFDISRASEWRPMLQHRVPFIVDTSVADDGSGQISDLRSPKAHLANIRQTLNPAVADLAAVFGVSRQAIYKWITGDTTPEPEKLERIQALSQAADAFQQSEITRAPALLKMKVFDGASLLDLVANGRLEPSHVQALITEAQAMESGYQRSGLTKTKAKPTEDWRTELSIPGSSE